MPVALSPYSACFLFQAAAPLMRYLERELHYMNENLVQENFNRYKTRFEPSTRHSCLYLVAVVDLSWFNLVCQCGLCRCFSPVSSLLTPLWNNSVKILYQVATQHPQQEGLMVFCQRLLYTLQVCPQHQNYGCSHSWCGPWVPQAFKPSSFMTPEVSSVLSRLSNLIWSNLKTYRKPCNGSKDIHGRLSITRFSVLSTLS